MKKLSLLLGRLWLSCVANAALLFGMRQRALESYRLRAELDPADEVARATVGAMLMERGDAAGAIDQFLQLLERNPSNAEAWFNLGYVHEQQERLADAERCFRRAIELKPAIDRAWYGLGLVLIRLDRLPEALPVLKKVTELQPFSPFGWYQLAMTHHHLGSDAEAWRVHEEMKRFDPKYAAVLKRDLAGTPPLRAQPAASADASKDQTSSLSVSVAREKEAVPAIL